MNISCAYLFAQCSSGLYYAPGFVLYVLRCVTSILVTRSLKSLNLVIVYLWPNNKIMEIYFQVPLFLFMIFTVYTMLPFQLWYAVVLSVISSLSHIIVLTLRLTIYSNIHTPYLANQVKLRYKHCVPWFRNVSKNPIGFDCKDKPYQC